MELRPVNYFQKKIHHKCIREISRNNYSLPIIITCCHSLHHSLPLVVIRCTTHCHSLSVVATRGITRCHLSYTSSDNEWQGVAQSVTTNDNKRYKEWQKMTMSDSKWNSEWKRVVQRVMNGCRFFFWVRIEEPTTKQPKEKLLNLEEDLEEDLFI